MLQERLPQFIEDAEVAEELLQLENRDEPEWPLSQSIRRFLSLLVGARPSFDSEGKIKVQKKDRRKGKR